VVKKDTSVEKLLQVTYASDKEELVQREKDALILGSNELKCSSLEIVAWDLEKTLTVEGKKIRLTAIWKWLLDTTVPWKTN